MNGREIIVAVDDSDFSKYAFRWTLQNVYREGDTIGILHVEPLYTKGTMFLGLCSRDTSPFFSDTFWAELEAKVCRYVGKRSL
jgi:hypothetical protein